MDNMFLDNFLKYPICYVLLAYLFVGIFYVLLYFKKTFRLPFWISVSISILMAITTVAELFSNPLTRYCLIAAIYLEMLLLSVSAFVALLASIVRKDADADKVRSARLNKLSGRQRAAIFLIIIVVLQTPLFAQVWGLGLVTDVPSAIMGHYLAVKGTADNWGDDLDNSIRRIWMENNGDPVALTMFDNDFDALEFDTAYTFEYLPKSSFVVNILDQTGKSLLK